METASSSKLNFLLIPISLPITLYQKGSTSQVPPSLLLPSPLQPLARAYFGGMDITQWSNDSPSYLYVHNHSL